MQKHSIKSGGTVQEMFNLKLQKPNTAFPATTGDVIKTFSCYFFNPFQSSTTVGLNMGKYAV
jgi:hypothetical protein